MPGQFRKTNCRSNPEKSRRIKLFSIIFWYSFQARGSQSHGLFHVRQAETDPEKAGDAAISRQEDIKRILENKLLERRIRHGNGQVRTKQSHPDAY